ASKKKNQLPTGFLQKNNKKKLITKLIFATPPFITIYAFTKISYLFRPIVQIVSIIGSPFLFAVLFYYLFEPIVSSIERKDISRKLAVWVVFFGVFIILALVITFIIPGIGDQFRNLFDDFPRIWANVLHQIEQLLYDEWLTELYQSVQETDILTRISEQLTNVFTVTIGSIGSAIGIFTRIGVTVLTTPFILYYLLVDGSRLKKTIFKYTPSRARPIMEKFIFKAGNQVGSYVRGQLLVALSVTVLFYLGYKMIGLEYALVLSITAGFLNLIPYIGSILSSLPAMIIGAFVSPLKLLQVIIVLAVEQFIEGRFVSPQILGNSLDIHPILILFILLVSGSIFGFLGLVFGVPGFAVLRVIWTLFFDWFKEKYDYYDEIPRETKET
ncbi:MAG: AI-2E family transporter, partial [Atopostipes suicloacalis]|nr:AI-2E family transporter [Atopostipes suicloacalis]